MRISSHLAFALVGCLFCSLFNLVASDVSELKSGLLPPDAGALPPATGTGTGNGKDPGDECQDRRYIGECVERVDNIEFKPFVTYEEQPYSVLDPQIKNELVPNPLPFGVKVKIPQPYVTKVPVEHIKENHSVKRLKKIKETVEHVPIQNTKITRDRVEILDPQVTQQTITLQDVKRRDRRRVIRRPQRKVKTISVEEIREIPIPKYVDRVVIRRRPKYINVTKIQLVKKRVEIPKIIYKTLRIPKAVIRPGEEVQEVVTDVKTVPASYIDQEVNWELQEIPRDVISKEAKEIKIPYPEPTRIVRPIPFTVPVVIPEKEFYDVPKHIAEPVDLSVPCGYSGDGRPLDEYLPAHCPDCQKCVQCEQCQMDNYAAASSGHPGARVRLTRGVEVPSPAPKPSSKIARSIDKSVSGQIEQVQESVRAAHQSRTSAIIDFF